MGKPKQISSEDLIHSAKKQLVQKGQANVTLKNVAEAAGVTQGVVYYHFKTKHQLLLSVLQDFAERNRQEEKGRKDESLLAFLAEEAYRAQTGAEQHQLLFELAALSLHHRDMKNIMGKGIQQKVQDITEMAGGDKRVGRLLAAMLDGLALQALFDPTMNEQEAYRDAKNWIEEWGAKE